MFEPDKLHDDRRIVWPESLQPTDEEIAPIDDGPSAASLWIMLAGLVITTALVGVLTWRS